MSLSAAAKNAMLNALDEAVAGYLSLHTANPGTTGASEVSGGSYARQAVVWDAASGGVKAMNGTEAFSIPAGTTVTYAGLWSASTSGTFYLGTAIETRAYVDAGTLNVTAASMTMADA